MGIFLSVVLSMVVACSALSPERQEIVEWAYQIADFEKQLENIVVANQPLLDRINSRPPTQAEIDQLYDYNEQLADLYNSGIGTTW